MALKIENTNVTTGYSTNGYTYFYGLRIVTKIYEKTLISLIFSYILYYCNGLNCCVPPIFGIQSDLTQTPGIWSKRYGNDQRHS